MEQAWVTGEAAGTGGVPVEGLLGVRMTSGARVRAVCEGVMALAVVGDCLAGEQELRAALPAMRRGQWGECTRWPGSYWVIADNGRQRFVCGDLAGVRPVHYTMRGATAVWATEARLLGRPLVADLPRLMAGLAVGEHHWPHCTSYEQIRLVPGGYGLLLAPGTPPQLVDISSIEPVNELREGAARFGQALTGAVQDRVRAAGGVVGADLSGGLDSSSAVVLAADAGRVHAVTYTDGYTSAEDTSFATRVAQHCRIQHSVAAGARSNCRSAFPPGSRPGRSRSWRRRCTRWTTRTCGRCAGCRCT